MEQVKTEKEYLENVNKAAWEITFKDCEDGIFENYHAIKIHKYQYKFLQVLFNREDITKQLHTILWLAVNEVADIAEYLEVDNEVEKVAAEEKIKTLVKAILEISE